MIGVCMYMPPRASSARNKLYCINSINSRHVPATDDSAAHARPSGEIRADGALYPAPGLRRPEKIATNRKPYRKPDRCPPPPLAWVGERRGGRCSCHFAKVTQAEKNTQGKTRELAGQYVAE